MIQPQRYWGPLPPVSWVYLRQKSTILGSSGRSKVATKRSNTGRRRRAKVVGSFPSLGILSSLATSCSQFSRLPSNVTDGVPQQTEILHEKYFCKEPIMRMDAAILSESVVVPNKGIIHVRSSGSTTFCSIMSIMRTANLPKSTVWMFPPSFTSSSFCPSCATNRDRSSSACALMKNDNYDKIENQTSSGRSVRW